VRTRLFVLILGCLLLGGCVQRAEESAKSTLQTASTSSSLTSVMPSLDSSASMDHVVAGIAARKAAEEARVRAIAEAQARQRAKALAEREAPEAAQASHYTPRRRYAAAPKKKHELTEAEKAAAMKALAIKRANEYPPPVIIIFR